MDNLKYRKRLSTSIDKELYKAVYNYSIHTRIPLSRLMDEAIMDLLNKHQVPYETAPSFKEELHCATK